MPALTGEDVRLADYAGNVIVLIFGRAGVIRVVTNCHFYKKFMTFTKNSLKNQHNISKFFEMCQNFLKTLKMLKRIFGPIH